MAGVRRRRLPVTFLIAGVLLALPAAAPAAERAPRAEASRAGPAVSTVLSERVRGRRLPRGLRGSRLPRGFLGFGTEYRLLFAHLGRPDIDWQGPNQTFYRLMGQLSRNNIGPVDFRVGGGSTDDSWWNPNNRPNPPGVYTSIRPWMVGSLRSLHEQTGARLVLGLNLAQRNPEIAADWARAAMAGIPRRAFSAFEIGNEPDIYPTRFFYEDANGNPVMTRPRSYGFNQWLGEFGTFARRLRGLNPVPPLAGPTACCYTAYDRGLRSLLRNYGRALNLVTYHWWTLDGCTIARRTPIGSRSYERARPAYLAQMLNRGAMESTGRRYGRLAALARRAGKGVRMTEIGPAACDSLPGVTDSNGSAQWAVDWLFTLWANRIAGVNFHSGNGPKAAFQFNFVGNRSYHAKVNPQFYGIRLFAEAASNRARLALAPLFRAVGRRGARASVWATFDRRRTGRLVVVNQSNRRSVRVRVRVRRGAGRAKVAFLRAPSLGSTTGISWKGQRYAFPTEGQPLGRVRERRLRRRRGYVSFSLPKASSALLTVRRAR